MTFLPGAMRVFDRSGKPLGSLTGWSMSGPPSFRISEVEDFSFTMGRSDGATALITGASPEPTVVGLKTASGASAVALGDPTGTAVGDTLVAFVAHVGGDVATTGGWERIHAGRVGEARVSVFLRVVRSGDFAVRSFSAVGATAMHGTLVAFRGARGSVGDVRWAVGSGSSWPVSRPNVAEPGSMTLLFAASVGSTTFTSGGATSIHGTAAASLSVGILRRSEPAVATGGSVSVSAALGNPGSLVALTLLPVASVETMLRRDNLVHLSVNLPGMRPWSGPILNVTYQNGSAQVQCSGIASLLSNLSTSLIEQDEGLVWTAAARLIDSANAKQAAHGDLLVEFLADDTTAALYGKWQHEGDVLQGIQNLAQRAIAEFWTDSWVDTDGRLHVRLRWGSTYAVDMTGVTLPSGATLVLKDGPGGNLTPGTTISFSGAERVNYGRLYGAQTDIAQFLNYPSAVMGLTSDIVPQAIVSIPEPDMPGARRREALDLSVDWGFSRDRQKGLAETAENRYIDYYRRFLSAYHARFGMPFLDGFDWSGPDDGQTRRMSLRHFRTTKALAYLKSRDIVFDFDPEDDAEVTLEGWHRVEEHLLNGVVGIAFDFTSPRYRWCAMASGPRAGRAISARFRTGDPPVIAEEYLVLAVTSGETVRDVATHANEPGTLWALTHDGLRSIVRAWDIDSATLLYQWSASADLSGIAVDVPTGALYASVRFTGTWQKRDLTGGSVLTSYSSDIQDMVGVSVSGGVAYLAGRGGRIEMRFTEDGAFAGSKTHDWDKVDGLFVDPVNTEVWVAEDHGSGYAVIGVYAAAVAVASVDEPSTVDGAPGFPALAKGTFVRVVMTDNRDLGAPPETGQRGILPIHHLNQFGRYVNGTWVPWNTAYDHVNCIYTSGAMLLERHTRGKLRKTPPQMRTAAGAGHRANNFDELEDAWKHFGETLHYAIGVRGGRWNDLLARIREGRGIVVKTDFDGIPEKYRCQAGYRGDHGLYLHRLLPDGTFEVNDPLCRAKKRIPAQYIRRAAGLYVSKKDGLGKADFAWSKVTTLPRKVDSGDSRNVFLVWSSGRWVTEVTPNAPGEPSTLTKRWDPGDQKSGFKKRSAITLASPTVVVYGEEGRVADWDPITMGYGREGTHYYKTKSGDWVKSTGWYLVPWDRPVSEFSLGAPRWDDGEAYLTRMLNRYNREQGSQVLGVVNVDSVWQHMVLGGIYNLDVSLQGPEGGIAGHVRVVSMSPDPTSGTMQVLAEWWTGA